MAESLTKILLIFWSETRAEILCLFDDTKRTFRNQLTFRLRMRSFFGDIWLVRLQSHKLGLRQLSCILWGGMLQLHVFNCFFLTSQLTSNIAFKMWISLTDLQKSVSAMATPPPHPSLGQQACICWKTSKIFALNEIIWNYESSHTMSFGENSL